MILSIALMFSVLDNIKHNFTLKKGKEIKTKEVMVICIIEVHMETLVVTKTLFNRNFAHGNFILSWKIEECIS